MRNRLSLSLLLLTWVISLCVGVHGGTSVDIPLYEGWNMISLPLQPSNTSTEAVLSSLTGIVYLYWYNASEPNPLERWEIWDDTLPPSYLYIDNTLLAMETNRAYWLWVDYPQTLSYEGTTPSENIVHLYQGWNFVGFQMYNESVRNATQQLTDFRWMYWYNASEANVLERWRIWDNTLPPEYWDIENTLNRVEPNHGYWLWVDSEQVWEEGSGNIGNLPSPSATYVPHSEPCTFWSRNGNSKLDSKPIPSGTRITACDPDGVLCGTYTVKGTGQFAFNCIADNPSTPEDEGAELGDTIDFYLDGQLCTVVGGSDEWQAGFQEVDIKAYSSVGGICVPVDKQSLLAPWIGLASLIIGLTAFSVHALNTRKKNCE